METMIKTRFTFAFIIIGLGIGINYSFAKDITKQRKYEPVVLAGGGLSHFYDVPVDEIFLYAYSDSSQSYEMMPFQIDERVRTFDPFHPGSSRRFVQHPRTHEKTWREPDQPGFSTDQT